MCFQLNNFLQCGRSLCLTNGGLERESHSQTYLADAPSAAAASAVPSKLHLLAAAQQPTASRSPNDQIQIALIGAGIRGQQDAACALQVSNTRMVAVADCYDGRLAHAKELWGRSVFTTRDYREILARRDVDAASLRLRIIGINRLQSMP